MPSPRTTRRSKSPSSLPAASRGLEPAFSRIPNPSPSGEGAERPPQWEIRGGRGDHPRAHADASRGAEIPSSLPTESQRPAIDRPLPSNRRSFQDPQQRHADHSVAGATDGARVRIAGDLNVVERTHAGLRVTGRDVDPRPDRSVAPSMGHGQVRKPPARKRPQKDIYDDARRV
jgi:hypothetical protein